MDGAPTVAVIPGDDAAAEAMEATLHVLRRLDVAVHWDEVPDGAALAGLAVDERDELVRTHIDRADTVLFGSTNGTTPGIEYMRWSKGTFANVRPIRWRPGFVSPLRNPEGIDYVIVRENLEDAYVGVMGDVEDLRNSRLIGPRARIAYGGEGAFAAKIITRAGTERVARFALDLARKRRGHLTVSAKTNMLPKTDRYFCDIVKEIAAEYPDITVDQFIVDDMAHRLVSRPYDLDVLLLPNLYGDVLSDEGAATIGGLGLAPSGCFGDNFAYFESAHGTAPDLVGQRAINPTATMLSAALLLNHLGLDAAATRLDEAISTVYAAGKTLTADQGGKASTDEFAAAVADAL